MRASAGVASALRGIAPAATAAAAAVAPPPRNWRRRLQGQARLPRVPGDGTTAYLKRVLIGEPGLRRGVRSSGASRHHADNDGISPTMCDRNVPRSASEPVTPPLLHTRPAPKLGVALDGGDLLSPLPDISGQENRGGSTGQTSKSTGAEAQCPGAELGGPAELIERDAEQEC